MESSVHSEPRVQGKELRILNVTPKFICIFLLFTTITVLVNHFLLAE